MLSTKRSDQPKVHVKLTNYSYGNPYGWYVIYEDMGSQIYLRSLHRKNPLYFTVSPLDMAAMLGNNMSGRGIHSKSDTGKPHCVWDPDFKMPIATMRSLPDPFGNCAILDRNFNPPIPRAISSVEF